MRASLFLRLATGLGLPAALLLAAPAAHAGSSLSVPVPQPGQISVAAAKSSKNAPIRVATPLPDGVVALGAMAGTGAKRRVVVALVRPSGGRAGGPKRVTIRAAGSARLRAPAVLAGALAARGASLGSACGAAPKALGRVLARRGAPSLTAADARRIGTLVAGVLCGKPLDVAQRAMLAAEGLAAPGGGLPGPAPSGGDGGGGSPAAPGPASGGGAGGPGGSPAGSGGTGTPPVANPSGPPACSNGKDDDGDGQVDHVNSANALVDPGCLGGDDASEDSEKTLAKGCGLGVYTKDTAKGFGADFDSLSYDHCPKRMAYGIVDLAIPAGSCADARWEGTAGGSCLISTAGNVVVNGRGGDQWDVTGQATQSLCGTQAYLYGWTRDGTAYEQKMPVFDGAEACTGKPPVVQCANGIDDDADGQVDLGATPGKRADPGCDSATDASETGEETGFGEGCVAIVVVDPDQPRLVYPMLLPVSEQDACPTVKGAWAEFADGLDVTGCDSYYGNVKTGTCTVAQGGLISSGATGASWGADAELDADASCSIVGRVAVKLAGGGVREGATIPYRLVGNGIERCP